MDLGGGGVVEENGITEENGGSEVMREGILRENEAVDGGSITLRLSTFQPENDKRV